MSGVDLSIIGKERGPVVSQHTFKDVALYALAVGAGTDELDLVYEGCQGGIRVLPSYCVVPAMQAWPDVGKVNWSRFLHGEQSITLHRPIPAEGKILSTGRVQNIYDKGKGALYHIAVSGTLEDGSPLYETLWSAFYVGAGGFGGPAAPKAELAAPPQGVAPDFEISQQVAQNQAALYRLCGDLNPLHIDPRAAKAGGFDRPILHGLCTYGFVTRAIIKAVLLGDSTRLKSFKARFSSVVYPGDTLITRGWLVEGRYVVEAATHNGVVLSNGEAWLHQ